MLQHLAPKDFEPETITLDGRTLRYRSCRGVPYCERPQDPIQVLNIFVPEAYFEGGSISGYTAETAPVFCPSTVGGYMPGPAAEPGPDHFFPTNAVFEALAHGYVIAGIGVRGRTTGSTSTEFFMGGSVEAREAAATGRLCGRAPAFIVDLKAGIRYLRTYAQNVPGDLGRIVTNGTSAGGAHSALAGTSGDSSDYTDELERIGAVMDASDAIFAASCYCPIHNLDHADMAYEWQFKGIADCHYTHFRKRDGKIVKISEDSVLTAEQQELSEELACAFPAYVRSLGLTDKDSTSLTLAEDGTGSFLDWIERQLIASAQRELETGANTQNLPQLMTEGSAPEALSCLSIEDGTVKGIDWPAFVRTITRMKPCPAFDALDLHSPENEEFGTEDIIARHFTAFSQEHTAVPAELAPDRTIRMMNPLSYVSSPGCCTHWRIRHGSYDRDTSLAIPAILALSLANAGKDVDFRYPCGLPHSGDYDLPELFSWIDGLCLNGR